MTFRPAISDEIIIDGVTYRISEHPHAPGMVYGQEGRQAIVYQLIAGAERRALKVFKPRYQVPALVALAERLAPFAALPGLTVCRRTVLTPQRQGALLRQYPDLTYAVLMPWIHGPTWLEVTLDRRALVPTESLHLAHVLADILSTMEQRGLAHCDLSGPNILLPVFADSAVPTPTSPIELVDVEQMYGPGLERPEALPSGSLGYAHRTAAPGLWSASADRFAGAVLLAELLGWCDARVRRAAWGESYFDPQEMQQPGERARLLTSVLKERWGPGVGSLYEQAWQSSTLAECPTFGTWLVTLPEHVPAAAGGVAAPVDTAGATAVPVLLGLAQQLAARGNLDGAVQTYHQALALLPPGAQAQEVTDKIRELEVQLAPEPATRATLPGGSARAPATAVAEVDRLFAEGQAAAQAGEWAQAQELLAAVVRHRPNYRAAGTSAATLLATVEQHLAPAPAPRRGWLGVAAGLLILAVLTLPWIASIGSREVQAPTATPVPVEIATATSVVALTATAPIVAYPALITPAVTLTVTIPTVAYLATITRTATMPPFTAGPAVTATQTRGAVADCSYGGEMKSIEAVDDLTVKFTLCAPDPAFPSKIAFSSLEIQSAKHLQDTGGGTSALLEHPLGTGPYMLKEWVRGDHLTLVANPNYWGPQPALKTVIFKWNSEAAARLTSLKSGEVDGFDNPDPSDVASIQADSSLKLYPREALNVFYLGFNNTKTPLDNEKVRQALAMGIDRAAIVQKFYPAGASVADYFTPCAVPGGCAGDKWYDYNLPAAKQMLTAAGFANGFNIKLSYRNVVRGYLPSPDKVAQELQAQLKQLNITATIDQEESGTFLDNAAKGNLELYLLGWGADYPDQTDFLDTHFGKGATDQFGKKFDDITTILSQAGATADQATRNKLYAWANNLIKQHVPMIPVAHGGSADVFNKDVAGAYAAVIGGEHFKLMSIPGKDQIIWSQNAEPLSLYCADESDGETLRACEQIFDSLLSYKEGGTDVEPGLADLPTANADLAEWTVKLHSGIKFSDGTPLTAKDVVASYVVQWDAANKLHVGNTGEFIYWPALFGAFLNQSPGP